MIMFSDMAFIFTITFSVIYITYKLIRNHIDAKEEKAILDRKINLLCSQQDELLESTHEHVSTFSKIEGVEYSSETNKKTAIDNIKIFMKTSGLGSFSPYTFIFACSISAIC